jgi:hypothetical protein
MAPKAHEARAAQRTIMAQMEDCIDEHTAVKGRLDACELPVGVGSCGSPPSVVHVHHQALCVLVGGQRILLQRDRDLMEAGIDEDDARRLERRERSARPHADDDGGSLIEVDRKKGTLKASGTAAVVMAVVVVVVMAVLVGKQYLGGAH